MPRRLRIFNLLKYHYMIRTLLCLLTVISLTSCKSNSSLEAINTGVDSSWSGDQQYKLLVVTRLLNPQIRELFESEMARALLAEGVSAAPSSAILPNVTSINQGTIRAIMARGQNIAILFTDAATVNRIESNSNSEESSIFSKLTRGDSADWQTKFSVVMESGLYIHGQDTAVWWNRTKLEAEETATREAATDFVKREIKMMKKAGVIKRLK